MSKPASHFQIPYDPPWNMCFHIFLIFNWGWVTSNHTEFTPAQGGGVNERLEQG